jgi:membrane protease YdiL (CAAX protease family)
MGLRMTEASPSRWPLVLLLLAVVMLIPLDRPLFGLPVPWRLVVGALAALGFALLLPRETPARRRRYLALALPLAILVLTPIGTDLAWRPALTLGAAFVSVLILPTLMLRGTGVVTYRFWPERLDPVDIGYTLLSVPLAWGGFALYFGVLSPDVPYNWTLPPQPDDWELLKLFMGINAVGIWDELFFINICFAVLRSLFPFWTANLGQSVIYVSVLYQMAFSGWGPLFIAVLALTQGAMYERSKVLLWVLLVHLIVDYFLFQAIVDAYYPELSVWWHP